MKNVFDTTPDFINDKGVKWWKDESSTQYARRKDRNDISLKADVFFVEDNSGYRTRILIDDNEIIEEDPTLEGMGVKIDIRKSIINMEKSRKVSTLRQCKSEIGGRIEKN